MTRCGCSSSTTPSRYQRLDLNAQKPFFEFPLCRILPDSGRVVTEGKCSPAAYPRSSCLPVQNLTGEKTMPAALNALAYMRGRFCWVIYDAGGKSHSPGCFFIYLLASPLLLHSGVAVPLFHHSLLAFMSSCHSLASFSLSCPRRAAAGAGGPRPQRRAVHVLVRCLHCSRRYAIRRPPLPSRQCLYTTQGGQCVLRPYSRFPSTNLPQRVAVHAAMHTGGLTPDQRFMIGTCLNDLEECDVSPLLRVAMALPHCVCKAHRHVPVQEYSVWPRAAGRQCCCGSIEHVQTVPETPTSI